MKKYTMKKTNKKNLYMIEREKDYQKLTIKEALIIHEKSPKTNVQ